MAYQRQGTGPLREPRNVGSFDKADEKSATGMVGAPACGDVMKLQIRVNEQGVIEDARFKTYGCGSAIASSSLVTEWVRARPWPRRRRSGTTQIAEELALPPVKIHCSILAEDAIKAAIVDYRKKHGLEQPAEKEPRRHDYLTERAANHVNSFLAKRGRGVGLRLGVRTSAAPASPTGSNTPTR